MFLQLWPSKRTRGYRVARDRRRREWVYQPGIDCLDDRCLLSAHLVTQLDQAAAALASVGGSPAVLAITIPGPLAAPSASVAKAAIPPLGHNPGASSSAPNGNVRSTGNVPASPAGLTIVSITDLSPNLFATPLTTTAPPAASPPSTAAPAIIPLGPGSAPATAGPFGQALLVSQGQILWPAHLGQEDDLGDNDATGSAVDGKKQEERFVKFTEKPSAAVPTKAPEQRPAPASATSPAAKVVPILPEEGFEPVLDMLDHGLRTALFEAGSSRPESTPEEPGSWHGFWAMFGSVAFWPAYLARHVGSPISNAPLQANKPTRNLNDEL